MNEFVKEIEDKIYSEIKNFKSNLFSSKIQAFLYLALL